MSPKQLEHGTPEAYDAGCTDDRACPALEVHGLTCATAHYRFVSGERRYMQARGQRLTPTQIARKLGISSHASLSKLDEEEISRRRFAAASAGQKKRHAHDTPDAAQPLAESSPDRMPTHAPADAPSKGSAPAGRDEAGRREEMGHPTTTTPKETPGMPTPTDIQQRSPKLAPAKRPGKTPPPSASAGMTAKERADIRAWARADGWTVSDKARIPAAVVNAYRAAHTAAGPATSPSPTTPALADFRQDFGPRSDQLDETRARIDQPVTGDQILAAIQGQPATVNRDELPAVEWAEVTVSIDVESARRIAISLEQELSKTETERVQALAALGLALRKWETERAYVTYLSGVAERQDRTLRLQDGSDRLYRDMLEQAEGELREKLQANVQLAYENAALRNQLARPWWKRVLPWT